MDEDVIKMEVKFLLGEAHETGRSSSSADG
jgi:hypothetical protein